MAGDFNISTGYDIPGNVMVGFTGPLTEAALRAWFEANVWPLLRTASTAGEAGGYIQQAIGGLPYDSPAWSNTVQKISEEYLSRAVTKIQTGQDPYGTNAPRLTPGRAFVYVAGGIAALAVLHRVFFGDWFWESWE